MKKLDVRSLSLAIGISCGAYALFLGWMAAFGWGNALVNAISSVYIGYAPGFLGGIIGALWAFVDGAIGGAIIAVFYNALARK